MVFYISSFSLNSQIKFDSTYFHYLKNYKLVNIYCIQNNSDSFITLTFNLDLDSNYFYDTTLSEKPILVQSDKKVILRSEIFEDNPVYYSKSNNTMFSLYKSFKTNAYTFYKNKKPCSVYVFNDTNYFMMKRVSYDYTGNTKFTSYYFKQKTSDKYYDFNKTKYIWMIDKRGIIW